MGSTKWGGPTPPTLKTRWISISFCAHLHPFCRGNWTGDGQIARAAWKNNCCTLKVQLQRSHPFDGQKQCGSQEKQNYHCMVAGVSLEEYAFGQMSNQQWEKPDLPQLKTWIACKNCWLPTTSQLHYFAHNLRLKSFYTLLAGGCPAVVILVQGYLLLRSGLKWIKWAKWEAQLGRNVLALCFYNFNSRTHANWLD